MFVEVPRQAERFVDLLRREGHSCARGIRRVYRQSATRSADHGDVDESGIVDDPRRIATPNFAPTRFSQGVDELLAPQGVLQRLQPVAHQRRLFKPLLRSQREHP